MPIQNHIENSVSEYVAEVNDIDNELSYVVERLSTLQKGKFHAPEDIIRKEEKVRAYTEQNFCRASHHYACGIGTEEAKQTLFINASIKGDEDMPIQLPWMVDLNLQRAGTEEGTSWTRRNEM